MPIKTFFRWLTKVSWAFVVIGVFANVNAHANGMSDLVGATNVTDDLKPFFIVTIKGIWPTHQIDVCWESAGSSFREERELAHAAVVKFIEKNSSYRFGKVWPVCDADQRARIRISIEDMGPHSDVGYQIPESEIIGEPVASPTSMTLNFVFANWGKIKCNKSKAIRLECIRTIVVHEFLHALGAIHEQLSADLESLDHDCWELYQGVPDVHPTDAKPLTDYDRDSIMNYCRDIYAGQTRLSERDLKGLNALSALTAIKSQK